MSSAAVTKRTKRTPRTPAPAESGPIHERLAEIQGQVRRGEHQYLGRIVKAWTSRGDVIDFRAVGPFIGKLQNGAPVMVSAWRGLPPVPTMQQALCDSCRADCDLCNREGKRACHICGGCGQQKNGIEVVRRKEVPVYVTCPACKGEKLETCPGCEGSGQMPTGRDPKNPARLCQTCNGNRHHVQFDQQDLEKFAHGTREGMAALGPLVAVVIRGDQEDMHHAIAPDHEGNYAVIWLGDRETPAQMLGGVLE